MDLSGPDILPRKVVNQHLYNWTIFAGVLRSEKRIPVLRQYMREELVRTPCRAFLLRRIYTRIHTIQKVSDMAALAKMERRS